MKKFHYFFSENDILFSAAFIFQFCTLKSILWSSIQVQSIFVLVQPEIMSSLPLLLVFYENKEELDRSFV